MRLLSDIKTAAKIVGRVVLRAAQGFGRDNALELSAALSYYSIFSLAPLLVIVIAVAGFFFGRDAAEGEIFTRFRDVMGPEGALALQAAVEFMTRKSGGTATALGVITLLLGASGVFGQLRSSLDKIWGVAPARAPWLVVVRSQALSYAMVLFAGFMLLVSLVLSTVLAAFGHWASQFAGNTLELMGWTNAVVSYGVVTVMFAIMFKALPDIRIQWRDVWIGALITSFLFSLGRALIGFYIVRAGVGSSYGLAGSVLVILAWVYYSSLIFFFGAECTAVFAREFGSDLNRVAGPEPVAETGPANADVGSDRPA